MNRFASTVLALLALAETAAHAQQGTQKEDSGEITEVVVTAQFREQNLQETPLAITAITGEMLEARSQTRIADVTAQAPNVLLQVNPAGGGNSMRAFIRGVGQGDQSPAVDPGVGIYAGPEQRHIFRRSGQRGGWLGCVEFDRLEAVGPACAAST